MDVSDDEVYRYVSAFMTPKERAAKERALASADGGNWIWLGGERMPELPPASPLPDAGSRLE